jgi:hypothetical protein
LESKGLLHGPVLLRLDPKNIGIGPLAGRGKTRRNTISANSKHCHDHENASWINGVRGQKQFFRNLLDSNTPEGKAFLEYMSDDPYSKDYKPVQVQDLAERLKEIDDLI